MFKKLKFIDTSYSNKKQAKKFYKNGYGVSVIIGDISYGGSQGLYELAVLKGDEDRWEICYSTPITDDVLGYLTEEDVSKYMKMVKKLERV